MKQRFEYDDVGEMTECASCKIDKTKKSYSFTHHVLLQNFED